MRAGAEKGTPTHPAARTESLMAPRGALLNHPLTVR